VRRGDLILFTRVSGTHDVYNSATPGNCTPAVPELFQSPTLNATNPNYTLAIVLDDGVYPYACSFHFQGKMGGSITVQGSCPGFVAPTTTTVPPTTTTTRTTTPAATTTPALANLVLVKDDCVSAVVPGSAYTYSFTVSNTGGTAASGVTLTDTWPSSVLQVTSLPGSCSFSGSTINCGLGTIAAGGSTTISIGYTVRSNVAAGSLVSNCATVTTTSTDSDLANNDDCDLNTVVACRTYNSVCGSTSDCCQPLQCLRHASNCNATVESLRCAVRGGSSIGSG